MREREIAEAVRKLSGFDDLMFESMVCKISNIDIAKNTCTCSPIDGTPDFLDVLLSVDKSKGFLLIPKSGSLVIVTQTSDTTGFISMVSDVDQIYLCGDANEGLIKIQNLKTQWDANVSATKAACAAAFAAVDTAITSLGGAGTSAATFNAQAVNIKTLDKNSLENTKVKHGNG